MKSVLTCSVNGNQVQCNWTFDNLNSGEVVKWTFLQKTPKPKDKGKKKYFWAIVKSWWQENWTPDITHFVDENIPSGAYLYRVIHILTNGDEISSNIVTVTIN